MPRVKYDINYLKKIIIKSDIINYDYVYIYSDLRYFLFANNKDIKKFTEDFLNIFLNNNQTIIVPTFSYSKKNFDTKYTRSKLGYLSNYILSKPKSIRSLHPLFSYVAIGKKKKILKNIGKSAFGQNSLHQRLLFKNCCFFHIGRPLIEGNTLVHHVEQNLNAKYRFDKSFNTKVYTSRKYIGKGYSAYVRRNYRKSSMFYFGHAQKKINNCEIINRLSKNIGLKSIFYYSYDEFYFFLHKLFLENDKIFLK